jgi:hypothetical protein
VNLHVQVNLHNPTLGLAPAFLGAFFLDSMRFAPSSDSRSAE